MLGSGITELKPVRPKGPTRVLEDDWLNSSNPNRDLSYLWTGRTRVKLNPVKLEPVKTTPTLTPSSMATSLAPDLFPVYDGDNFPDHWDEDRKEQSKKYYKPRQAEG